MSNVKLLLILLLICGFDSKLVPIQLSISQAGLDLAVSVGNDRLTDFLLASNIKDVHHEFSQFKADLTNIKITSFQISGGEVSLKSGNSLVWSLGGISLSGNLDWGLVGKGLVKVKSHGNLVIEVLGVNLINEIRLEADAEGKMIFRSVDCRCTIDNLNMDFKAKNKWIYYLLADTFKTFLIEKLEEILTDSSRRFIDDRASKLVPNSVKLWDKFIVYLSLIQNPSTDSNKLELLIDFKLGTAGAPPPSISSSSRETYQKAETSSSERMMSLVLSETLCKETARSLFNLNFLKFRFDKDHANTKVKEFLSTDCSDICFSSLMSDMATSSPKGFYEISFETLSSPDCVFDPKRIRIQGQGILKVFFKPDVNPGKLIFKPGNPVETSAVNDNKELLSLIVNVATNLTLKAQNGSLRMKLSRPQIDIEPNPKNMTSSRLNLYAGLFFGAVNKKEGLDLPLDIFNFLVSKDVSVMKDTAFLQVNMNAARMHAGN